MSLTITEKKGFWCYRMMQLNSTRNEGTAEKAISNV